MPDVAPVLRGVVRPAAQDPDPVAVSHRGEPDPRSPRGMLGQALPLDPVGRGPDVVPGAVSRDVVTTAHQPDLAVVDDGRMISPGRPGGARELTPPFLAVSGRPDVVFEA